MKLVSIILPIYKVEKYLNKCIDSVLGQTYSNLEVILVDDGSPDGCGVICDQYAQKNNKVKVIHKVNEGLGYARNSGLSIATGEYVLFIDSDDWIETDMVEKLVLAAENNQADFVCSGFHRCYSEKQVVDIKCTDDMKVFSNNEEVITNILVPILGKDPVSKVHDEREMCVWTNLYSSKVIRDYGIKFVSERELLTEDLFFNITFLFHTKKAVLIPNCLYYYRLNNNSLSQIYRPDKILLLQKMTEKELEITEKMNLRKIAGYRIERMYFARLRHCLMQVSESKLTQKQKVMIYTEAINNKLTKKICNYYLCNCEKLKDKLMIFLIRRKKIITLKCYLDMQGYCLKIREFCNL